MCVVCALCSVSVTAFRSPVSPHASASSLGSSPSNRSVRVGPRTCAERLSPLRSIGSWIGCGLRSVYCLYAKLACSELPRARLHSSGSTRASCSHVRPPSATLVSTCVGVFVRPVLRSCSVLSGQRSTHHDRCVHSCTVHLKSTFITVRSRRSNFDRRSHAQTDARSTLFSVFHFVTRSKTR